jgi:hypothetical protein
MKSGSSTLWNVTPQLYGVELLILPPPLRDNTNVNVLEGITRTVVAKTIRNIRLEVIVNYEQSRCYEIKNSLIFTRGDGGKTFNIFKCILIYLCIAVRDRSYKKF